MEKNRNREMSAALGRLLICFLAGAVAGIVFVNLAFPYRSGETEVLGAYVIEKLREQKPASGNYFCYLLEQRCGTYLLFACMGMTVAARLTAVFGMTWTGFLAGAMSSMVILQYGVKGMLFFLAANLPQAIFYVPFMLILLAEIYRENGKIWKKPGSIIKRYVTVSFFCFGGWLLGIVAEAYGNPRFLVWIFSKM